MVTATIGLQAATREAAVTLLRSFGGYRELKLSVYPGRPKSIAPPHAFVDRLTETVEYTGLRQRRVVAEVVVIHGLFDSADAVAQKDEFVDGFMDWAYDNFHAAGANTSLGLIAVEDEPNYIPDWQAPEVQRTYYATRISLEGRAG